MNTILAHTRTYEQDLSIIFAVILITTMFHALWQVQKSVVLRWWKWRLVRPDFSVYSPDNAGITGFQHDLAVWKGNRPDGREYDKCRMPG